MKTLVGIVILSLAVAGLYVLNNFTRTPDGKSRLNVAGEAEIQVEVANPQQRDIIQTVQAPGEVEAFAEVDISSEVVAKILEMPVEEGDYVQAGDLLCRLDDADHQARVLSAQANVAKLGALITQAEAELRKAELDWDQMQRLRETEATSAMEVNYCHAALTGARAMLEMRRQELIEAEAALQSAREALEKTVIRSPISGVVSQRFAKPGEVVVTGTMNNPGTRIMVISDLSKMQVRCRVDEADAPLVAPDQPARIYLQSDTRRSVAGRVLRVASKGTKPYGRDVVTFETLVLITEQDPRVKPGMTANVEIEVASKRDAVTIPVQAVVYRKRRDLPADLGQEYDRRQAEVNPTARQNLAEYIRLVFCVVEGKAYPRLVQTGINDVTNVEITGGLNLTDLVVTGPYRSLDQLKEGSRVKLKVEPVAATSQPAAAAGQTDSGRSPTGDSSTESAPAQDEPDNAESGS